jgi:hypothetical protein
MMGGILSKPKIPAPTAPEPMPTPDDDAIKAAKRRSIAANLSRTQGRESTILSEREGL